MSEEIEAVVDTVITDTTETALSDYQVAKKLIQLKQSADSRSIEFDLKFSTVKKLLSAKKCYYTGVVFATEGTFSRSIDRVDSNKGYLNDNVVACTIEINGKKSNLTIEDITTMYEKIVQFQNKKKTVLKKKPKIDKLKTAPILLSES